MKPYVYKQQPEDVKLNVEKAERHFEKLHILGDGITGFYGMSLIGALDVKKEEKDGAYFERNMLALYTGMYANKAWKEFNEYLVGTGKEPSELKSVPPCGWYNDTDNNCDGWKRVISLFDGKITFQVPDDFDTGNLPQIEPNWDGHSTEEKWWRMMTQCGCKSEPLNMNGWLIERNPHNGFKADKEFIVFHPIYDGQYWKDFDNMAEVRAFATKERFAQWSEELI